MLFKLVLLIAILRHGVNIITLVVVTEVTRKCVDDGHNGDDDDIYICNVGGEREKSNNNNQCNNNIQY